MIIVISGFCRSAIALRPKSGWRNGGTLTGCLRIADLSVVSELTFNIFAVISRLSYLSPQAWMIAIKQIQVVDQEDSIGKIGRKTASQIMARDEQAASDAQALSGLVFPEKHLQERLYSIVPFLAKFGPGLVAELFDRLETANPDHRLLIF